ncbi:hypothetical protein HYALB_00007147 [Hymenoscyphus albidus]|uniref:Rhodopsin domain-containing protein n=1 Tax=Hymenoscyphus albidus TaxID=595503 RepID=A0A9N9LBV1_9HELO|nr:hypothetical protein HYALB_00007147 [Hymenoscyphus albidus]
MASMVDVTMDVPDESKGPTLLVLTCVLTAFSIVTTCLRVWARYRRSLIGWDDMTIAICMLLSVGRTIIQIVSVKAGNGRHKPYLTTAQYQYVNFLTWATQLFLFVAICILKCSICLLILRIKKTKLLRQCLIGMMGGLILTNGFCLIVLLAECDPVKKYWDPKTPGKCWDTRVRIYSIYVQVAYSVITDVICTSLPVVVLWNVKIKLNLKIAVSCLMSLGLIATICAVVRATSLGTVVTDLSYDYCIAAIWANTELHLGIIATNLSLSRSIYAYYSGRESMNDSEISASNIGPRSGTFGRKSRSRGTLDSRGWMKSRTDEEDNYTLDCKSSEGIGAMGNGSTHVVGRGSMGSAGSQIPLGAVIKKTTEFHVTEEKGRVKSYDKVTQERWNQDIESAR